MTFFGASEDVHRRKKGEFPNYASDKTGREKARQ